MTPEPSDGPGEVLPVTEQFRATHDLLFPVLSDFNREVSARDGVLYEEFFGHWGVSKRAAEQEPDYAAVQAAAYIGPPS